MAEVLVTHSYSLEYDKKQKKIGQPYAPLGTLYAATILKRAGINIGFYDPMFAKSTDEFIPVLETENPKIIIIYDDEFSYLTKMCLNNMREAAFRMIQLGKAQQSQVIIYSSDAMDNYQLYLDKGADFVIRGEGEITLQELVEKLQSGKTDNLCEIHGIVWKNRGQVWVNKPREVIMNLDDLPFPAWELIDVAKYRHMWQRKNGYFSMNMVTTRGCPYHCVWCAKPVYGNHYSSRSPYNVVAELQLLKQHFSPDEIWFADDIFGLKPDWIDQFARMIHQQDLKIPFIIQSRVDLLLENQQIHPLAQAGCRKIWLGIESGSQKILDAMQKGTTVEQIRTVSPMIREAGMEQAFFLQLGFPGETHDDIAKTIQMLDELMPDDIGISVTYPLPGTKFYEAVKKELKFKTNWKNSDDIAPLITANYSPGYYKPLHSFIHKDFRFKQAGFYLKTGRKKRTKFNHGQLRRVLLLPYYLLFSWIYKMMLLHKEENKIISDF
jgi:anaerobic magnesium-protoporphyrin IX monomethyl ester cyclase